jgi:hypothetical protein
MRSGCRCEEDILPRSSRSFISCLVTVGGLMFVQGVLCSGSSTIRLHHKVETFLLEKFRVPL